MSRRRVARAVLAAVVVLAAAIAVAGPASQRLGRTAGACVLVAPREAEGALQHLGEVAPDILARVSNALGLSPRASYRIALVPAGAYDDPDIAALDRRAPQWAAGYMDPIARIGGIRLAQAARYPYGTPEAVLAHESAHLLIHDAPNLALPHWYEEGVATWVARDWQLQDQLMMSGRVLTSDLPRLDQLEPLFQAAPDQVETAYAASFSFVSWAAHRYGDGSVRDVLREARTRSFERAWRAATGERFDHAESQWRRDALIRYRWIPGVTAFSTLWLVILALSAWVWSRRRARARALEARWAEEEEDAAESSADEWWREAQDQPDAPATQEGSEEAPR